MIKLTFPYQADTNRQSNVELFCGFESSCSLKSYYRVIWKKDVAVGRHLGSGVLGVRQLPQNWSRRGPQSFPGLSGEHISADTGYTIVERKNWKHFSSKMRDFTVNGINTCGGGGREWEGGQEWGEGGGVWVGWQKVGRKHYTFPPLSNQPHSQGEQKRVGVKFSRIDRGKRREPNLKSTRVLELKKQW